MLLTRLTPVSVTTRIYSFINVNTRPLTTTTTTNMRLPYVPDPPPTSTPDEAAIVTRIQERRAPRPLQALDLTLLHSPPVADGWNSFLGAVRTRTEIPADLRELAISRVAVINTAWYEWGHHAPLAISAGVSQDAMDWLKVQAGDLAAKSTDEEGRKRFSEKQWAVLLLSDEMTRHVRVSDATFGRVKAIFSDKEVVEVVATVACYNCVSRFLVALDVGEKNGTGPEDAH